MYNFALFLSSCERPLDIQFDLYVPASSSSASFFAWFRIEASAKRVSTTLLLKVYGTTHIVTKLQAVT